MRLEVTRDIENRAFSVEIAFKEYGNESLSTETELRNYKDFGFPKVDVGGQFVSENLPGTTLVLNKKLVEVNEGFSAKHSVKLDSIAGADDQEKIQKAENECSLFQEVILSRLNEVVTQTQSKASVFLDGYPKDVIV